MEELFKRTKKLQKVLVSHRNYSTFFAHEPLQKPPRPSLLPETSAIVLKPKYQFSLRGNIKDWRDLRGGVIFETLPYA